MEQDASKIIPQISGYDDFRIKFSRLPDYVQKWMCSLEITKNNTSISQKFNLLSEEKNILLADITAQIILKEILLEKLPDRLIQALKIDNETAKKIAAEIALKQLLPVRSYLAGVENFIVSQGGSLPAILPKELPIGPPQPAAGIQPPLKKIQKAFRLAVQENKEILNQLLTASPIKVAEFEQPVRPSIKNWLSDYIRQKGAGRHEQLERSDYLFNSPNAKMLAKDERAKLAEIIKAYDNDAAVPVSEETKLILIEELSPKELPKKESELSRPTTEQAPMPAKPAASPTPFSQSPLPARPTAALPPKDIYRETTDKKDSAEPQKPPRPAPRIEGNIIDLKDPGKTDKYS